ncbi:MAG TPA: hypothetical protein VIB55_17135, partial [Longimicrobium sp.]
MKNPRRSDEEFTQAVQAAKSIRAALRVLGLAEAGGNYKEFRKRVERLGLDISHFDGQGHGRGSGIGQPLAKILIERSSYTNTNRLRLRLIGEGILNDKCSECGLREWRGKSITLHLDHVNGVGNDHRRENLRL